jgi:hypothetical protein
MNNKKFYAVPKTWKNSKPELSLVLFSRSVKRLGVSAWQNWKLWTELNWHLCIRSINCYWNKWNRTSHSNLIFFPRTLFLREVQWVPLTVLWGRLTVLYWNFYQLKCSVSPPCFDLIWGDVIALYKAAQCIRMGCHMYPLLNQSYFSQFIPP